MQSRSWCFTVNNYEEQESEDLKQIDCKYIVFGREVGEAGTPHLQGYVHFEKHKRLAAVKKLQPRAHWEPAKGSYEQNRAYCTKEDKEPFEKGVPPPSLKERQENGGKSTKRRYEEAVALAKKQKIDEIDADLQVKHYGAFKAIAKDNMEELPCIDTIDNYWYHGPSGIGKSRKAYEEYPGAYRKMCNKWWDGYKGEEVVIIDDLDKKHDVMAHHLKIWGDHYPFIAESKGGAKMIRPKKIIITSNYTPEDIWGFDEQSRAPIERRYKIKTFPLPQDEQPTLSFPDLP